LEGTQKASLNQMDLGYLGYLFQRIGYILNGRILKKWGALTTRKSLWNVEFSSGQWDFLDHTSEDPIYYFLDKYSNKGSILDLGCGSGNTGNEIDISAYCSYTGVDLSEVAIQKALTRSINNHRQEKNDYFCDDILSFVPRSTYNIILFRESIHYFSKSQLSRVLAIYNGYLKESGVFIVRMANPNKYDWIVRLIEKEHAILERSSPHCPELILVFKLGFKLLTQRGD